MDCFANRLKKRGKHLEGRLGPYAQQVARLREQWDQLRLLRPGSAGLARRVVDRVYQPRQGGLPATRIGRQQSGGLNHFLYRLSRSSLELT